MPVGLHASHRFCFKFGVMLPQKEKRQNNKKTPNPKPNKTAENRARPQIHLVVIYTLKCMGSICLTEKDTHALLNETRWPTEWSIHHTKCFEKKSCTLQKYSHHYNELKKILSHFPQTINNHLHLFIAGCCKHSQKKN